MGLHYAAQGKFMEAKTEFEKASETDSAHISIKRALKVIEDLAVEKIDKETAVHFFKGWSHAVDERWNATITEYDQAIMLNPNYAESCLGSVSLCG